MYTVIVPTYNECGNVEILCNFLKETFTKINLPYNIIFIDDASSDGTYELICQLRNEFPILAIRRTQKLGLGSAYKHALKYCDNSEFVIIMDADLSQNPFDIQNLIRVQQKYNYDLVYGTRYNNGNVVNWPFLRKVISRGANNLAQILLGVDITDYTNSFRLYKTSLLKTIAPRVKSDGFAFQMEVIYRAARQGFKIGEYPVIFHDRCSGTSKMKFAEIFWFAKTLLTLVLYRGI
ncbi:Dolichol-phosphate mannosyltransferase [Trachipleistophora hominis]|uniref:Dolichol-phosphate mannosyltransferase subunit 1 n=1 Tax=Trachipleistophora hominis TaxID=72359 RepID=L7JWC5_TRAHO|nr:Dolichol-phosphate mannosyltransferase [Trachipleistophora hominis]